MAEGPARGLLNLARGDRNVECHYRKVYQPITAMTWAEELNAIAWEPTENYKAYNLRKAEYQERIGAKRERNILLVKLGSLKRTNGGSGVVAQDDEPYDEPGLLQGVRGAADQAAATATGVTDEYLSPHVLAEWTQVAVEVHESLEGLKGTPLSREELVWLIRKPLHGDLPVPPEPVLGSRAWGPNQFDLVVDFSGENRKTHIVLNQYDEVTGEQQTSYTTTLVAANWPAETRFRQSTAWARYASQHVDFPVEIDMRFTLIPYLKFKDRADKIRGNLVDEMNDMANSGRSPDTKLATQVTRAQDLVDDIDEHKMPGMEAQIRFTISAHDVKELERLAAGSWRCSSSRTSRSPCCARPASSGDCFRPNSPETRPSCRSRPTSASRRSNSSAPDCPPRARSWATTPSTVPASVWAGSATWSAGRARCRSTTPCTSAPPATTAVAWPSSVPPAVASPRWPSRSSTRSRSRASAAWSSTRRPTSRSSATTWPSAPR